MTVRELINSLLDEPMDSEVELETYDKTRETPKIAFSIDSVSHWNGHPFIKFTDWRLEDDKG